MANVLERLLTYFCSWRKARPLATSAAMLVSLLLLTSSISSLFLTATRLRRASKYLENIECRQRQINTVSGRD